ncbi:hypothetical protein [Roseibium sp.]|uniref:AbiTii domain-containing protein n=1 Tax=Roseibium sp. TaxID=1936156 RepID=UPI003B50D241
MSGLIFEIQRDALSNNVPIEDLLRRVKLAAAKLELDQLEDWVDQELNGYSGPIPEYRVVNGQPRAFNPYNGWIPIISDNEKQNSFLSEARVRQSVSSLRDLIENPSGDGTLHLPLSPELIVQLNQGMAVQFGDMVIRITRGSIVSILDHVRNKVLDWAIEMERKGVIGESMSFNADERKEAKSVTNTFHFANVGSIVGNVGTHNTTGNIAVSSDVIARIVELSAKIETAMPELQRAGADVKTLSKTIAEIETETAQSAPASDKLAKLLSTANMALAGAAGNLAADGAILGIGGLLTALGG